MLQSLPLLKLTLNELSSAFQAAFTRRQNRSGVQKMPETSEEAVELLQKLLILHYREEGLPKALMEPVEEILRGLGEWLPDPRFRSGRSEKR